ncbi:MAG: hypothetical protein ACP5KI_06250 [Brevinematia bacterium]
MEKVIDLEEIDSKSIQDIIGISREYLFLTSLENYSTHIYKETKRVKIIERFICKNIFNERNTTILAGALVKDNLSRLGTLIYLDKNLNIINKIIDPHSIFSEFVWSDGKIVISNSLKEDIFNGDIIELNSMNKLKLPYVITGEYEFRSAVKYKDNYIIYGNDKDNYRGIIVKITLNCKI